MRPGRSAVGDVCMTESAYAVVDCHDQLLAAIRKRIIEFQTTHEAIEDVAGLQSGYLAKILGKPPKKRLHPFLMLILLQALGLKTVLIHDPAFKQKMAHRLPRRRTKRCVRMGGAHHQAIKMELAPDFMRHISRLAADARRRKITPERRSALARHAAQSRWRNQVDNQMVPVDINSASGVRD